MPRRRAVPVMALAGVLLVSSAAAQAQGEARAQAPTVSAADLADVGRLLMVSLPGTSLDPATRALIAHNHVGGVILFGRNVANPAQLAALDRSIHAAAGHEKVLTATDQEGGTVRRLAFDAPSVSAAVAGRAGPHGVQALMTATGRQLHAAGIDVDLAPVSDTSGGFLGTRSYGRAPAAVVAAAVRGLQSGGVDATAKHFPGLGGVRASTDAGPAAGGRVSAASLAPFVAAVKAGARLVMVDLASHPGLGHGPAALQAQTYALLAGPTVAFTGATITDGLDALAVAKIGEVKAAVQAVAAGADIVLAPGSAALDRRILAAVTAAVRNGQITPARYLEALTHARNVENARR